MRNFNLGKVKLFADGQMHPTFASLVVNPPPPPMQPLGGFDAVAPTQQPMTNYQSVVQAPTMFAPSNLSGMNVQLPNPNLGVVAGNQQGGMVWSGSAAGLVGGIAFGGQEHSPMMAQPLSGLLPGVQVLAQQPTGHQIMPGLMGSQNHVLVNQPMIAQHQPMVPIGTQPCLHQDLLRFIYRECSDERR